MNFSIGDRVRAKINDVPGLRIGEYGTIVSFGVWDDAVVEWDEYNPDRHDADGLTKDGHGWFVSGNYLELILDDRDLGQLPEASPADIKFLFDM